jgi:hypothetical protein
MSAALRARRQSDLPPLLADLPAPRQPVGWAAGVARRAAGLTGQARATWNRATWGRAKPRIGSGGVTGDLPSLSFPRGTGTSFKIGRDRRCDLAIDDMTVSRVHARLERTAAGWLLTDLSSTNGTRVNGWLVRDQVAVRPGDIVRFGNAEYALGGADGAAAAMS